MPVEVGNVSGHGFWLFIGDREHFLSFDQFPWFRDAPIRKLLNVQLPHPHHVYWPDLDIDLAVDSIEHPKDYPLVSRARPDSSLRPAGGSKRRLKPRRASGHANG